MLKHTHTVMVLCAGFGSRMEELSTTCPKPLLPIRGRPMIDPLLTYLRDAGIRRLVVNIHHLGEQIEAYLAGWADAFEEIVISREETIQGVGGGIRCALPLLGEDPFFVLNGDVIVTSDGPLQLLETLETAWDDNTSSLLSLIPTQNAWGYTGVGDFFKDQEGLLTFRGERSVAPYVYGGIQMLTPDIFHQTAPTFSMLPVWKLAQQLRTLKGVVWTEGWFHVGTKAAYQAMHDL